MDFVAGVRHKGTIGVFQKRACVDREREFDPIEKALYLPPEHFHVDSYMVRIL